MKVKRTLNILVMGISLDSGNGRCYLIFPVYINIGILGMDESNFQSDAVRFPILHVLIGLETGTSFVISKPLTTVGRGEDCDIQLNDRSVSRMHCEIIYEKDSAIIRDMNSQNGIRVNGRDTYEQELQDYDQIDIASVRLVIRKPKKEEE
jgi:hypothetical protein